MKSMTVAEIDRLMTELQKYWGYELTNVLYNEKVMQLSLSKESHYVWLTFCLKPQTVFFIGDGGTRLISGLKKPLPLFLKTHIIGRELLSSERVEDEGRVVQLNFSEDLSFSLKISLFPGGQNILVKAGEKSMTAFKPRDLVAHKLEPRSSTEESIRNSEDFLKEWQEQKRVPKRSAKGLDESELRKILKKKTTGLEKMRQSMEELQSGHWQEVGEWLKTQGELSEVPEKWQEWVDQTQSIPWNIERIFKQMKKQKQKVEGTQKRIEILQSEILQLERGQWLKPQRKAKTLMHVSEAKGRTRTLSDGSLFYVGKSAKDNLALLRRAKSWFLWLHIRDYPGAYGILERQRKEGDPSPKILQEAAREVLRQTLKGKSVGSYEVLIAECRYVRPIKGGKPGQVTHSHEKVLKVNL